MADETQPTPQLGAEEESPGAPAWIVTFADMMSLLLCFFVLMLSMSSTDARKFKAAAESLQKAFSFVSAPVPGESPDQVLGTTRTLPAPAPTARSTSPSVSFPERLKAAKEEIDWYIANEGLDQFVETSIEAGQLKIVNSNPLNFPSGKAEILASSKEYLNALVPVIERFDFNVVVEGHTDDQPINNAEFHSNWELSSARAASFVYYLEDHGVNPARLSVQAFGPHRPLAPNTSEVNRARNRRIEIRFTDPAESHSLG